MKILYISGSTATRDEHGNLLKFQRSDGIYEIFQKHGDKLIYPEVFWYEGDYLFPYLEKIVEDNQINMIVGYSAGGYIGYHLCNKYQIPGIQINPAMATTSEAPTLQILPNEYKNLNPYKQLIIIGEKDRVIHGGVDGHLVDRHLKLINYTDCGGRVIIVKNLYHDVPHELFEEAFKYFTKIFM